VLEQLDLTGEQKEKVAKFMKEAQEKQEMSEKKVREAVEQAKQSQDREKVRGLFEAHEKEMAKLHEELQAQVLRLLTEGQRGRLAELTRRRPEGEARSFLGMGQLLPPPVQERLGLTPEQREKVARLQKEMEEKLRDILTQEQNQRLEELRRGGVPPERRKPPER